tara:strand:+ start:1209 stop:1676 length:468 start_codon:yes stop_codon:yes gene_type:complete
MTDMDNDTNWDEELESLNDQEEVGEIRFGMIADRFMSIINEWSEVPVWALPPQMNEDEDSYMEMKVSDEPFEGGIQTTMGDISALPLMGVVADIIRELFVEGGGVVDLGPDNLKEHRHRMIAAIKAVMVEGILISNAPEWSDKFDDAAKGLRDFS